MSESLKHIALIPDGNRRWAKAQGLPVLEGHRRVVDQVFPDLVTEMLVQKIPYFTIWGFSTENWSRPEQEVGGIMELFKLFFSNYARQLKQQGVRLSFIGRRDNLTAEINSMIEQALEITETGDNMTLTIAYNYGGRDEIVRAVNKILALGDVREVGETTFGQYLDTSTQDIPDPDLIIRTSGEQRLSGFMSWQSAYSEFYFSPKMMPEWTKQDLRDAIADYQQRGRRFGA